MFIQLTMPSYQQVRITFYYNNVSIYRLDDEVVTVPSQIKFLSY